MVKIKIPDVKNDHRFLMNCAEDFVRESLRDTGELPRGGVIALGCMTYVVVHQRRRIGALVLAAVRDGSPKVELETLYLVPGWRGQGMVEPVLRTVSEFVGRMGLGVYLRGPVHPAMAKVGERLGLEIGGDGGEEMAREVELGNRYLRSMAGMNCTHKNRPCVECLVGFYRAQVGGEKGMYLAMLNGWKL